MSINNCDIDFKTCEKSKKYKRSDIDEIARKCGINPNEYKSRKTLCEAIVAKNNGDIPSVKSDKASPAKKSKDDCDIPQNICEKSKKYKRDDINDIAQKCGIDNPKKYKSRKDLCMAILEKRGVKPVEEPKKEQPKKAISPKCNKKSLESCSMEDLKIIAKEENIKNYSGKKKDELIKYIKETRQKRKNIKIVSSDDEDEEPKPVEPEIPDDVSSDEDEIPVKPKKKESPKKKEISKDCDKKTLENCKATDLAIIAKEENMKKYSKYKKEELKNFIKQVRKNRGGIYEDSEDEEDDDLSPMTEKKLRKIIKEELQKIGTFDIIESRFKTIKPLRKYVVEEIKKEYTYFDEIIKDFDFKNIFNEIVANMKEEYEEDDQPISLDKSKREREVREQREREAREQRERESREQREREQREREAREAREQREREQREREAREAREQREREQREREQREREQREREQREREQREREQREREDREQREREAKKKVVFRSPLESSKSSIEDDEDLFMENLEDLFLDVEQMDISEDIVNYMENTLVNMSKEDLLKIYKRIFDTNFNPNRKSDMETVKMKREIIKDIIEYIQQLSYSFYDLYKAVGDKRYEYPVQTDYLAINKYNIYDIQDLINTLYKKYSKDIVTNFEVNMLRYYLSPWQKDQFIKKTEIPKVEPPRVEPRRVELPRGDIEDVLDRLQKSPERIKECNPYEEKFCEGDNYCDISEIPGKCISKDFAERSEMTKINYKGYNIIGDPVSIDKLYEFGVPLIDIESKKPTYEPTSTYYTPPPSPPLSPKYTIVPSPSNIYKINDEIQIIETREHGKIINIVRGPDGEEVVLVKILPDGIEKIFKYEEITAIDYIDENRELPKEKEVIEDLEEKEAARLRELEELRQKAIERERRTRAYMLKRVQEDQEMKERERVREQREIEDEERKEREEERTNKEKIRYENIDTLLSEIGKRSIDDVDNIDIVNNQVLKCLGLVA